MFSFHQKLRSRAAPGRGERGFTLLELLVALAILAVGLLMGVFPLQISAMYLNSLAFQKTTATHIAQSFIDNFEQFRLTQNPPNGLPWANNAALSHMGGGLEECPPNAISDGDNAFHRHQYFRSGVTYYLRWEVQNEGSIPDVKKVTASVIWMPARRSGQYELAEADASGRCLVVKLTATKYCSLGDATPGRCP